jgi:hypothetical protein
MEKMVSSAHETRRNATLAVKEGLGILAKDPTIMAYPIFAAIFVFLTYAAVSSLVLALWHSIFPHAIINIDHNVPSKFRVVLGIVTFYYFYTAVVTSFFTCATSAAVWAKLEGHPTTFLHGLAVVGRHFLRVVHFAVLSIFYVPLGFVAQRKKILRKPVDVIGSSFTLHTANMAPAIINEKTGVGATIRTSINTLGKAWKEGALIKAGIWAMLLILIAVSFIPKLIQHHWFNSGSSHWLSWLITGMLLAFSFVITKVLGAVFMTVLYHKAQTQK